MRLWRNENRFLLVPDCMALDPIALAYLATAALATAALHSVGGFAGGLMLAIVIAPIVGVKATVPVTAVAMIVSHASRAWLFRNSVDWQAFRLIFLSALPFILLGVFVYIDMPERGVAIFLGIFLLITVPLRRLLAKRKITIPRKALVAVAIPYGFLSGASFGAGLLLGPFMLGAGLAGEVLLATAAMLGFMLNIIKTIVFGFSPTLTQPLMLTGFLLGLCTIPGHHLGRWVVRKTPVRIHTYFLEAVILLGGLYFLIHGYAK